MLSPIRQKNPRRRTLAYLLFVLPIVGLLAIFGVALRVPVGAQANDTPFSFPSENS